MSEDSKHAEVDEFGKALGVHRSLLHRAAVRILGCGDAARDAVQEALIALWRDPPRQSEPKAWLLRTVIHRALHQRRTRLRRQRWEAAAAEAWMEDCPLCNPQRDAESRELTTAFDDALASIPEPYRTTFVLREIESQEYDAIARHLGVPIGTVRSRLNRARGMLRAQVGPNVVDGNRGDDRA